MILTFFGYFNTTLVWTLFLIIIFFCMKVLKKSKVNKKDILIGIIIFTLFFVIFIFFLPRHVLMWNDDFYYQEMGYSMKNFFFSGLIRMNDELELSRFFFDKTPGWPFMLSLVYFIKYEPNLSITISRIFAALTLVVLYFISYEISKKRIIAFLSTFIGFGFYPFLQVISTSMDHSFHIFLVSIIIYSFLMYKKKNSQEWLFLTFYLILFATLTRIESIFLILLVIKPILKTEKIVHLIFISLTIASLYSFSGIYLASSIPTLFYRNVTDLSLTNLNTTRTLVNDVVNLRFFGYWNDLIQYNIGYISKITYNLFFLTATFSLIFIGMVFTKKEEIKEISRVFIVFFLFLFFFISMYNRYPRVFAPFCIQLALSFSVLFNASEKRKILKFLISGVFFGFAVINLFYFPIPQENDLLNYIDLKNEEIHENDILIVDDSFEKDIASVITPKVLKKEEYELNKEKINQLGLNVLTFDYSI